jgi:hypothetical protein
MIWSRVLHLQPTDRVRRGLSRRRRQGGECHDLSQQQCGRDLPNAEANRIERLKVATLGGNGFEIRPKLCILATAGSRMRGCLASNSVQRQASGTATIWSALLHGTCDGAGRRSAIAMADETRSSLLLRSIRRGGSGQHARDPDAVDALSSAAATGLSISLSLYEAHKPGAETEGDRQAARAGVVAMLQSLGATRTQRHDLSASPAPRSRCRRRKTA